jgi:hypothetical protein
MMSPADERVEQLIILTERLTDLIAKQATAFEARRPHEAARHVEETAKLANVYRHESARVRGNVALVQAAQPDRRRRLVRARLTAQIAPKVTGACKCFVTKRLMNSHRPFMSGQNARQTAKDRLNPECNLTHASARAATSV